MAFYLVFELDEEMYMKPGLHFGNINPESNPEQYEKRYQPRVIEATEAANASEACIRAAQKTKRLGNYLAVEAFPLQLDFSSKPLEIEEDNGKRTQRLKKQAKGQRLNAEELQELEDEVDQMATPEGSS